MLSEKPPVAIGAEPVSFSALGAVVHEQRRVTLSAAAHAAIEMSAAVVAAVLSGDRVVYGINTGVGALSQVRIGPADLEQLQVNLLRSHAAGVGAPLTENETRAILFLRCASLARGHSGVSRELVDLVLAFLNAGIHPLIPAQGSVGASGDLAPLAHAALPLIGEGSVRFGGKILAASEALTACGLVPHRLRPKEGIALINGTQVTLAIGALTYLRAHRLARTADLIGAMTVDALLGTDVAFDPRIQAARPHPGQAASARNLRGLLAGSGIKASHANCGRVQDAYSLRCMPQVHGAVYGVLGHVGGVLLVEMNSATDNPLVFADEHGTAVLSGGNFHAEPVALALDYLAIALAELGALSERRVERMVNPSLSSLPAFLAGIPGLESGMMMAQVTAA
ncbi:MAG: histidine ammonia-lyase, partial [Candidatus Schekmanbacteria bacterium]|nr:histidine ammonia-lyase [Candidatus Schekmanbacteria bacterium]